MEEWFGIEYSKKIKRETLTDLGLKFIKRVDGDNVFYFISNNTAKDIDEKIELIETAGFVSFTNPLDGAYGGVPFQNTNDGVKLRMQLKSGQSILVNCNKKIRVNATTWKYVDQVGDHIHLENKIWKIKCVANYRHVCNLPITNWQHVFCGSKLVFFGLKRI